MILTSKTGEKKIAAWSKVIREHLRFIEGLEQIGPSVNCAADLMLQALKAGNKIIVCGNGGSAADSQHFAAEIVGRFSIERPGWAAIALTTDTSILTAIGNDYGYDSTFSRQVEAIGLAGDVLVGISTSGQSANVIRAFEVAHQKNISTIALVGRHDSTMSKDADLTVCTPNNSTARVQESHILILHYWAKVLEQEMPTG